MLLSWRAQASSERPLLRYLSVSARGCRRYREPFERSSRSSGWRSTLLGWRWSRVFSWHPTSAPSSLLLRNWHTSEVRTMVQYMSALDSPRDSATPTGYSTIPESASVPGTPLPRYSSVGARRGRAPVAGLGPLLPVQTWRGGWLHP